MWWCTKSKTTQIYVVTYKVLWETRRSRKHLLAINLLLLRMSREAETAKRSTGLPEMRSGFGQLFTPTFPSQIGTVFIDRVCVFVIWQSCIRPLFPFFDFFSSSFSDPNIWLRFPDKVAIRAGKLSKSCIIPLKITNLSRESRLFRPTLRRPVAN